MNIDDSLIKLSWERSKFDLMQRVFIKPFELDLINKSPLEWLEYIKELLIKDRYFPNTALPVDVPKLNSAIRLGSHLSITDVFFYTLITSKSLNKLKIGLSWSANKFVYSHVIAADINDSRWVENPYNAWEQFSKKSMDVLNEGYNYVLFTDITAYYENINIKHLISDLVVMGVEDNEIKTLNNCLYKWSFNQCDGIPQGFTASDIFSNIYLNEIDCRLYESGFKFLRYGDDYRFFCKNVTETKQAQLYLTQLLRSRGLNLQNKKTETLTPILAKTKIFGVIPTIETVKKNIQDSNVYTVGSGSDYFDPWQEETQIDYPTPTEDDFIKETFRAYFIDKNEEYNKTLYKFCLNKLALMKDDYALNISIKFLYLHPEETESILKYLNAINLDEDVINTIACYISSKEAIYDYQKYQILNWVLEHQKPMLSLFLKQAKQIAFDANQPFFLKTICRLIVGEVGASVDLNRIKQLYQDSLPDYEKSEIIYSTRKMEKSKRNSFYSQIKSTNFIVNKTILSSKQF